MSMMASKNFPLSGAATDLGLGTMIVQQLQDQEAERKKKLKGDSPQSSLFNAAGMALLGGSPL